jgi:ribonuclease P protein component
VPVGRLVRSADFERLLGTPTRKRSAHFAVHYLTGPPTIAGARCRPQELSTNQVPGAAMSVDESRLPGRASAPAPGAALWLGVVVPKRHARRSVTRSLLKREMRAGVARRAHQLAAGLWLVRLRAPFNTESFASAASAVLRRAARAELDALLSECALPGAGH